jgi:polysaccharide biosynthesis transport protein
MVGIVRERDARLAAAPPPADEEAPVGELLNILRRRRTLILSVIVVLTTLATLYGLRIEPTYTATATVMIGSPEDRVVETGQVSQAGPDAWRIIETQARVIQSFNVILAAMEKLGVFHDPDFAPVSEDGEGPADDGEVRKLLQTAIEWLPDHWLAATGTAATRLLPNEWVATAESQAVATAENQEEDGTRVTGENTADLDFGQRVVAMQNEEQFAVREWATDAFMEGLSVIPSSDANVVSISYTYPDPSKAARFANAVIEAYIENQLSQKRASADTGYAWLSERLEALQDEVLAAEDAVERFRAENKLAPTGGTALSEVQLADLNRELITTRAERTETEAKLGLIRDLRASGGNLDSIAEVVASPLVARLREQEVQLAQQEAELATTYGPRHPRMEELRRERSDLAAGINAEVTRIARSLENELTVILTREQSLAQELEGIRSERAVEDQSEVRLRQLEREAAAKRTVYESFLARQQELKAREGSLGSNVRVLAPARVPLEPSSPSPVFFAAVGFTASTVLGCMLGLLREQLDKSLRSERQVERTLGLSCLGVVPRVKGLKRGRDVLAGYLCGKPRSAYAEGIRALYAALLVTDGGADPAPKVVLVTSALPGEGKTATASSLAVSAARAGHKVLLVDFDLRRPSVAREFGHRPHGGVVEVITGDQSLDQALISDEATGIDILPVRSSPADTTALLTSQRIRALLGELRQRYDFVVLDSPPLLAVTDARLLALHTDATVFVVRWERTKVDAAAAALKVLRDAGARIAGAVLTQVNLKRHARGRYGDAVQYYRENSRYYID